MRRRGRKPKESSKAGGAFVPEAVGVLFRLPMYFGYGPHWELSPEEQDRLGADVQRCLATLSGKQAKALQALLDKYFPWVSLAITATTITAPRVIMTRHLLRTERTAHAPLAHPHDVARHDGAAAAGIDAPQARANAIVGAEREGDGPDPANGRGYGVDGAPELFGGTTAFVTHADTDAAG